MVALRKRDEWACGWLQKADLAAISENQLGSECKACQGSGQLPT